MFPDELQEVDSPARLVPIILILAFSTGISVNPTGARKCRLTYGGVRRLLCMMSGRRVDVTASFLMSFSTKHYTMNVEGRSQNEHFLTKNVDI